MDMKSWEDVEYLRLELESAIAQHNAAKILETAAALKRRRIQAMKDAKDAARDSRQ